MQLSDDDIRDFSEMWEREFGETIAPERARHEALLLLEAREADGKTRWEFAFARFHFVTLTAWHNDQQVWHVEPDRDMQRTVFGNDPQQRGKIYYSVAKP